MGKEIFIGFLQVIDSTRPFVIFVGKIENLTIKGVSVYDIKSTFLIEISEYESMFRFETNCTEERNYAQFSSRI